MLWSKVGSQILINYLSVRAREGRKVGRVCVCVCTSMVGGDGGK